MSQQKMLCYVATHTESKRQYVGITQNTLEIRRKQHEADAKRNTVTTPFHRALREYGEDAFTWGVVAEGYAAVIKLLEHVLIEELRTNRLGGFNAVGGYGAPPLRDLEYERFAEKTDRNIRELDMLNDLKSIVSYCEQQGLHVHEEALREMGMRLLKVADTSDMALWKYQGSEKEISEEVERLHHHDEATRIDRVGRYLEVGKRGVIPGGPFSGASSECIELYRDGHFIATVMQTQAVSEGILKRVADVVEPGKDHKKADNLLKEEIRGKRSPIFKVLSPECIEAARAIRKNRHAVHYMNQGVTSVDFKQQAADNIKNLAIIEHEVFAFRWGEDGKLIPKHPQYWGISEEGTVEVYLRFPKVNESID